MRDQAVFFLFAASSASSKFSTRISMRLTSVLMMEGRAAIYLEKAQNNVTIVERAEGRVEDGERKSDILGTYSLEFVFSPY